MVESFRLSHRTVWDSIRTWRPRTHGASDMSEPSKFAVEASKAIYQADAMGDDITYAGIVQRAIDAARADLREQMTGLRRALVSEEGKTKAYQDRVTELEAV